MAFSIHMTTPQFFIDEVYKNLDFRTTPFQQGEYDNCTFSKCRFSELYLSNTQFVECEFDNCDFSGAHLKNCSFKEVAFFQSKLIGLHFFECLAFLLSFDFEECNLSYASFQNLDIKKTRFKKCNLEQTDFSDTNLSEALLDNCNLKNALFENTNLEKANLYSSYNIHMDPDKNRLKNAIFSTNGALSLLSKHQIVIK